MERSLPISSLEDAPRILASTKRAPGSSKHVKGVQKPVKRPHASHLHSHPSPVSHDSGDGRHKRVWKACERCRMKKTKCDGEFPCKRCKDDGLVCTAGTRKKTEYKQIPKGYAEVLENTQFALIATVHKLYSMVRNSQPWDLGEPDFNDRGQPVIHDIAQKLGCIRPNSDIDLPVHSVFPEDEQGLADLAAQLEAQQMEHGVMHPETESNCNRSDRASSSELDHSDLDHDYRKAAFGGSNSVSLSPQSLTYTDFESGSSTDSFPSMSPSVPTSYAAWMSRPSSMDLPPQYLQQSGAYLNMDLLNQGLLESNFGTIKPHVLSCPNPEVMMGMGDPMMYSGYEQDALRM